MKLGFFLVLFGLSFWGLGYSMGQSEGVKSGYGSALKMNPPSQELEMACAGLWIGQQNKKYWEKNK